MIGLLAAAVLLAGGAEAPQESQVKKLFPDAERVKRVTKRLSASALRVPDLAGRAAASG